MSKFNCPHPIKHWERQLLETPNAKTFPSPVPSYPLKYYLDLVTFRCVKSGEIQYYICTINSKEI